MEIEGSGTTHAMRVEGWAGQYPDPRSAGKPGEKLNTNGMNKLYQYLLKGYYVTRAKSAHLAQKTAYICLISKRNPVSNGATNKSVLNIER